MLLPLHAVASVRDAVGVGAVARPNEEGAGLIHILVSLVARLSEPTISWVVLKLSGFVAHAADPAVAAPWPKMPRLYFVGSTASARTCTLPGTTVGLPVW